MKRIAIVLAIAAGLALVGLMASRVASRGRFAPAYSTYGSGPSGSRGLFLLAEELDLSPMRWSEDLARLPESGMLVALGGCDAWQSQPLSRFEKTALIAWIESGGTLLVAGARSYLPDELGVALDAPDDDCDPTGGFLGAIFRAQRESEGEQVRGDDPSGADEASARVREDPNAVIEELEHGTPVPKPEWTVGENLLAGLSISVRRPADVRIAGEHTRLIASNMTPADPLAPKATWGAVTRRGRGAIVVLGSASMLQNRDLADGSAVFGRIVRAYAPSGPVIFDEHHLGVGETRSMSQYLREIGLLPFVVQILLLVALVLARFGARFGAPRIPKPPPPAGTRSFLGAVGTLYEKAGDAASATAVLVRHAMTRIAGHHHIETVEPKALAAALDARARKAEAAAVRELDAINGAELRKRDLVAETRRIDVLLTKATTVESRLAKSGDKT